MSLAVVRRFKKLIQGEQVLRFSASPQMTDGQSIRIPSNGIKLEGTPLSTSQDNYKVVSTGLGRNNARIEPARNGL